MAGVSKIINRYHSNKLFVILSLFLFGLLLSENQEVNVNTNTIKKVKPSLIFEIGPNKIKRINNIDFEPNVFDTLKFNFRIDRTIIQSLKLHKNSNYGSWDFVLNTNKEYIELNVVLDQQFLMEFKLKADLQLSDGTMKTVYSDSYPINDKVYPKITSFYNPQSVVPEGDTLLIPLIVNDNIGLNSIKLFLITDHEEINLFDQEILSRSKEYREYLKIKVPITQLSDYMLYAIAIDIHNNSLKKLISVLKIIDTTLPQNELINLPSKDIFFNSDELKIEWHSTDNRNFITDELFIFSEGINKKVSEFNGNKKIEYIFELNDLICDSCRIYISSTDGNGLTNDLYSEYFMVLDTIPPEIISPDFKIPNIVGFNKKINFHISLEDNINLNRFTVFLINRNEFNYNLFDTIFTEINKVGLDFYIVTPEIVLDSFQLTFNVEDVSSNKTKIRTDYFDINDNVPPKIDIAAPLRGESLNAGENYRIIWTAKDISGIDYQKLYYQFGQDNWEVITFLYNELTEYEWTVPNVVIDSANLKIEVIDNWGNSSYRTSDYFRILDKEPPEIEIIEPNTLTEYYDTDSMKINLNLIDNTGIKDIQLFISTDKNKFMEIYQHSFEEPTTGEFSFSVSPFNQVIDSGYIKVNFQDFYFNNGTIISKPFSILDGSPPDLKLVEPVFNSVKLDTFLQGDPLYIDWDVFENDSISSFKIFFLDYNGVWKKTTYDKIVSFYKWYISLYAEGICKIKIEAENKSGLKTSIESEIFFVKNINTIFKSNYRTNDSGWVEIITHPESVFVTYNQDSTIGKTPLKFHTRAGFGRRLFEFEKDGYYSEKTRKRIYKDSTVTIDVSLKPQTGTVNLYSNFDSTKIYIDDEYIGFTPIEDKLIVIGKHDFIFRNGKFYSDTINKKIDFNKTYNLDIKFDTLWSNISLKTDPTSVEVFIDNEYKGKTNLSSLNIKTNIGTHILTYKIPEINVLIMDTVKVEPGRDTYLEVSLLTKSFNNSYLSLDGWPTKSTVVIEDQILKTPLKYYPLKPGKNSIKISQMGFVSQQLEFVLEPRQHLKLRNYKLEIIDREKAISLSRVRQNNNWFTGYPGFGHLYIENYKWAGIWFGSQSTSLGITFHSYVLFAAKIASYLKNYQSLSNSNPGNVRQKRILFNTTKHYFGNAIIYSVSAHLLTAGIYKLCQIHIEKNIPSPFINVPLGIKNEDRNEGSNSQSSLNLIDDEP